MELKRRTRFCLPKNLPPSLGTILEELGNLTDWGQALAQKKTVRALITRCDKKGYEHSGGAADDCLRFLLNEVVLTETDNKDYAFNPLKGAAVLAVARKEDPNTAVNNMRVRLDKDQRAKTEAAPNSGRTSTEKQTIDQTTRGHTPNVVDSTEKPKPSAPSSVEEKNGPGSTSAVSPQETITAAEVTDLKQRTARLSASTEDAACRLDNAAKRLASLLQTS